MPQYPQGIGFRTACGYQNSQMTSPLYNKVQHLHITYEHPPVAFKLPLDYLSFVKQCKCYVTSC